VKTHLRKATDASVIEMHWICCQIGAREHYAVARALHRHSALELLITDTWVSPSNPIGILRSGLRGRFHGELATANVTAANFRSIGFDLRARMSGTTDWQRIIARNQLFQKIAVSRLSRLVQSERPRTVFAYSYAARAVFEFARARGWRTVLGQIDAGPLDQRIVTHLYNEDPVQKRLWRSPPPQYWVNWREECALADRVVVNSSWSQDALKLEGVPASKIRIIPVAYDGPIVAAAAFRREYPVTFSPSRPLRVLYLGNISLGKGVGPLFDAIRLLRDEAVEFWLVGSLQISIPADLCNEPRVHWIGPISRSRTAEYYRNADVFIFPTFSDGFGLTQLEAQAWSLPVITTKFCGDVIDDGRNGRVLPEPTGPAIAAAIRELVHDPERLRRFAANTVDRDRFGLPQVGKQWLQIFE